MYSMVETAKANGLDPYDYLLYALSVLPYYGNSTSHEMLETMMPWSSEVQQRIGKEAARKRRPKVNNVILPTAGSIMDPAANACWGVRLFSTYASSSSWGSVLDIQIHLADIHFLIFGE